MIVLWPMQELLLASIAQGSGGDPAARRMDEGELDEAVAVLVRAGLVESRMIDGRAVAVATEAGRLHLRTRTHYAAPECEAALGVREDAEDEGDDDGGGGDGGECASIEGRIAAIEARIDELELDLDEARDELAAAQARRHAVNERASAAGTLARPLGLAERRETATLTAGGRDAGKAGG